MSLTSEAKKEAKTEGVIITQATARKDSQGAYWVEVNGILWTTDYWPTADEAKADCIRAYVADKCRDFY